MEDVNLALELIKEYGFQPKEYNEMMKVLKEKRGYPDKEEKKIKIVRTFLDPFEKLQMVLLMLVISLVTAYIMSTMVLPGSKL